MWNKCPQPWKWANAARSAKASERRQYVRALVDGGAPKPRAAFYAGVSIRTLNRYLRDSA